MFFYVNDEPESKFLYTETITLYCIVLFGGYWKHPNNPACTKSVSRKSVGHYREEEKRANFMGAGSLICLVRQEHVNKDIPETNDERNEIMSNQDDNCLLFE